MTRRRFCLGQGWLVLLCHLSHSALTLLLLLLCLDQHILIYNGIWSRETSPIISCFFQIFFFPRKWILLVSVRAYQNKSHRNQASLCSLPYNVPSPWQEHRTPSQLPTCSGIGKSGTMAGERLQIMKVTHWE